MTVNIKKLCKCRACNSDRLEKVLDFGQSAIADDYFKEKDNSETYPLACLLCKECGLLQLEYVVDASAIYDDYIYVSSSSPGLDAHFKVYAQSVVDVLSLKPGSSVLDIGCNDGMLLKHFKSEGCKVTGVEPAIPIAKALNDQGINTTNGYWNEVTANSVIKEHGHFDVITSNNVFANVDDIQSFAKYIACALNENGVWVIETGSHFSLMDNFVFDNIYHEHLSYFSVGALGRFLQQYGMRIFHVESVPTKGGSIRVYAGFESSDRDISESVNSMIVKEQEIGLFTSSLYQDYMARIAQLREDVHKTLNRLKEQGTDIIGFGASATTTTVMHVLQLGSFFQYLIDDNPIKHETFSPGFRVEVRPVKEIENTPGACIVILPWRFADMFVQKNKTFAENGGTFLSIIPTVKQLKFKP